MRYPPERGESLIIKFGYNKNNLYIENKIMKNNTEICKMVITTLKDDGFFDNEWVDENKFRPRFYNASANVDFENEIDGLQKLLSIAEQVSKDIIRENIDDTMGDLVDKGLIRAVTTEDGEVAYELNKEYDGE